MARKDPKDSLEIRQSTFTHTFRLLNPQSLTYGETLLNAEICYVNVAMHDSIENIINTCIHESLHAALKRESMDDDHEHECIKRLFWCMNDMA